MAGTERLGVPTTHPSPLNGDQLPEFPSGTTVSGPFPTPSAWVDFSPRELWMTIKQLLQADHPLCPPIPLLYSFLPQPCIFLPFTDPTVLTWVTHQLWQLAGSEKAMAPHSSTLAWKIPWMMEEPDGLQSMGSLRVGHDWATSLSLCTFLHWRRKWQPTPVFLPGESPGQRSLVGCRLWGRTESDTTEATQKQQESPHQNKWRGKKWIQFSPLTLIKSPVLLRYLIFILAF